MTKTDKYQKAILTLNDGSIHEFVGKAFTARSENRRIVNIKFTRPKKLPGNMYWEEIT